MTDFGWEKPEIYTVSGQVTASPLGLPGDLKRLQRISKALNDAKKRKQLVTLVTQTWIADVVIKNVKETQGTEEGEALSIDLTLQTVERPTVETVQIDPSRLKNKRKSRRTKSFKEVLEAADRRETFQDALAQGRIPKPTVTQTTFSPAVALP